VISRTNFTAIQKATVHSLHCLKTFSPSWKQLPSCKLPFSQVSGWRWWHNRLNLTYWFLGRPIPRLHSIHHRKTRCRLMVWRSIYSDRGIRRFGGTPAHLSIGLSGIGPYNSLNSRALRARSGVLDSHKFYIYLLEIPEILLFLDFLIYYIFFTLIRLYSTLI
jgi:hypothetical protein